MEHIVRKLRKFKSCCFSDQEKGNSIICFPLLMLIFLMNRDRNYCRAVVKNINQYIKKAIVSIYMYELLCTCYLGNNSPIPCLYPSPNFIKHQFVLFVFILQPLFKVLLCCIIHNMQFRMQQ